MKTVFKVFLHPVTQFNLLVVGFLVLIQTAHLHAHKTMELDADSYVYNFCRKNVEKCERFINRDYWLMKKKDNKNLYEDVKRIEEQLNELQDQHLILLHQLGKINSRVGALENQSEWISNSGIVIAWNFGAGLLLIAEDQFAIKNLDKEMICG